MNTKPFISGDLVSDIGEYTLEVTATDEAYNQTTTTYNFSIISPSTDEDSSNNNSTESEDTNGVVEADINYTQMTELATEDNILKVSIPALATPEDATITIKPVKKGAEPRSGMVKIGSNLYKIGVKNNNGVELIKLNKKLTFEFNYNDEEMSQEINEEDFKVCYWDEKSQMWIVIPTKFDVSNNRITAVSDYLTIYAAMEVSDFPSLKDVVGHWAEEDVYRIVSMKIACGDPKGTFRPEDNISREEFAKLMVLAAGLTPESTPVLAVEDFNEVADWAKTYVAAAVKSDIMSTYTDNTFRPKDNITRAEIAKMIVKAFKYELLINPNITFEDAEDIPELALPYVTTAVNKGLISGFPDGTFRANSKMTRVQAVVIISRCIR